MSGKVPNKSFRYDAPKGEGKDKCKGTDEAPADSSVRQTLVIPNKRRAALPEKGLEQKQVEDKQAKISEEGP